MSTHSLEKADDKPESFTEGKLTFEVDDKPETDRDPIPHYFTPMARPDQSFFYNSRQGRFVFPFEESEQKQLVALDDGVESTLIPIADKVEVLAKRVWREVFTALRIAFVFIFVFIIELVRFVAHDIIHSFLLRVVGMVGDFLVKPLLVLLYNAIIQPILVFVWNILVAVNHMVEPAFGIVHQLALQIAIILRAFRLVEMNTANSSSKPSGTVEKV